MANNEEVIQMAGTDFNSTDTAAPENTSEEFAPSEDFWIRKDGEQPNIPGLRRSRPPASNNGGSRNRLDLADSGDETELIESLEDLLTSHNAAVEQLQQTTNSISTILEDSISQALADAKAIRDEAQREAAGAVPEAEAMAKVILDEAESQAAAIVSESKIKGKQISVEAEKTARKRTQETMDDISSLIEAMKTSLDSPSPSPGEFDSYDTDDFEEDSAKVS